MKKIVILLAILYLATFVNSKLNFFEENENLGEEEIFIKFHQVHEKSYNLNSEEGLKRFQNFQANLNKIKHHNSNPSRLYDMGVTSYADWTEEEWKARNPKRPDSFGLPHYTPIKSLGNQFQPINWTQKGINGPVYQDGGFDCRNTYVLAHTYLIESWNYLKTGIFKSLSPQNLVDCTSWDCTSFDNPMWDADYNFLYQNGVFESSVYPYIGKKGTCNSSVIAVNKKYAPNIWERPYAGNTDTETVYSYLTEGPLFFCSTTTVSYLYTSGLFNDYSENILCGFPGNCYSDGFMLVGYGIDTTTQNEYWIAKSTFGPNWGEKGYIRIQRNDANQNMGINCLFMRPGLKMN